MKVVKLNMIKMHKRKHLPEILWCLFHKIVSNLNICINSSLEALHTCTTKKKQAQKTMNGYFIKSLLL